MTRALSTPLSHLAVVLEELQATLPAPTQLTDGGDITGWRSGPFAPRDVLLEFYNADDAEVTITPELSAHLAGGGATAWCSWGLLGSSALTIPAGARAYLPAPANAACALFDRWAIVDAGMAGTTPQVTVTAIPLEVHGS